MATQKETIEYDARFLAEWNQFCDSKGYIKRQASHAARVAFMQMMDAGEREEAMRRVMAAVTGSRRNPSLEGASA